MIDDMACYPLIRGSASRARPSVKLNLDHVCTPQDDCHQPATHLGFPSGAFGNNAKSTAISRAIGISWSAKSGFATAVVKLTDAGFRRRLSDFRPIFASVPTGGVPAAGALDPLFLIVRSA
jgi:hypothetical protein